MNCRGKTEGNDWFNLAAYRWKTPLIRRLVPDDKVFLNEERDRVTMPSGIFWKCNAGSTTHSASLALFIRSWALRMSCEVWFIMSWTLVRLAMLLLIWLISLSTVVLLIGSLISKTCWATFWMLSGSAPSSAQHTRQTRQTDRQTDRPQKKKLC